jgi:hypothetical protein
MREKYLPVGTVVKLKNATLPMMITGYKIQDELYNVYDYCGCIYPIGYTSNQKGIFNHNQIEQIIFLGYEDENYQQFNKKILNN